MLGQQSIAVGKINKTILKNYLKSKNGGPMPMNI